MNKQLVEWMCACVDASAKRQDYIKYKEWDIHEMGGVFVICERDGDTFHIKNADTGELIQTCAGGDIFTTAMLEHPEWYMRDYVVERSYQRFPNPPMPEKVFYKWLASWDGEVSQCTSD